MINTTAKVVHHLQKDMKMGINFMTWGNKYVTIRARFVTWGKKILFFQVLHQQKCNILENRTFNSA